MKNNNNDKHINDNNKKYRNSYIFVLYITIYHYEIYIKYNTKIYHYIYYDDA